MHKIYQKIFLLLFVLGMMVYGNTLNTPFHFDDKQFIVENYDIRDVTNVHAIWHMMGQPSRFVALYTFALNYHVHKLNVLGYHLVNIIIHVMTAWLVWWLCRTLLSLNQGEQQTQRTPHARSLVLWDVDRLALGTALLFLLHPLQTQAVTYISQRFASLSTLWYVLALCLYVKGRLSVARNSWILFVGVGIAGILGVFTKEIVITLPFMILFCEHMFLKAKRPLPTKYSATFKVFFVAFIISFPLMFSFHLKNILCATRLSASHDGDVLTFWKYGLTQFRVFVVFLRLFLLPWGQNLDYDFPASQNLWELKTLFSVCSILGIILIAVKHRRKHPYVVWGILWFFIALLPNFVMRRNVIFEHKMYLPSIGLCLAFNVILWKMLVRKSTDRIIYQWVMLSILVILAFLTIQRNRVWQSDVTLWQDAVRKSPNKARPHNNLGSAYFNLKQYDQALAEYDKAIQYNPHFKEAYNNRSVIYSRLGKLGWALDDVNAALRLQPNFYKALINRGVLYGRMQQWDQAIEQYNQALRIHGFSDEAYNNRGNAYAQLHNYAQAILDYSQAIRINVELREAYNNRGLAYAHLEQYDRALQDFNQALVLNPKAEDVLNNRADVYKSLEQYDRAQKDYEHALALNPQYAQARNKLGILYGMQGQYAQAIVQFNKSLQINAQQPMVYNNRGNAYAFMGKFDLAIQDFDAALAIDPHFEAAQVGKKKAQQRHISEEAISIQTNSTSATSRDVEVQTLYQRAQMYNQSGKYDVAVKMLSEAIEMKSDDYALYLLRGVVYGKQKEYERALADLNYVARARSEWIDVYGNRGNVYRLMGKYDLAIEDYSKVIQLNPNSEKGYYNRGNVYLYKGDAAAAIADYTQALEQNPNMARVYFSRALAYESVGNLKQAYQDARKAQLLGHPVPKRFFNHISP
jgi:protein O-mannosyl-transferase